MWNVKWLSAFLYIVKIQCSMILGNYRPDLLSFLYSVMDIMRVSVMRYLRLHRHHHFQLLETCRNLPRL